VLAEPGDLIHCPAVSLHVRQIRRPAHRPRKGAAARINKTLRADPDTWARIEAEAKRQNIGTGQVVDRLAATLPPVESYRSRILRMKIARECSLCRRPAWEPTLACNVPPGHVKDDSEEEARRVMCLLLTTDEEHLDQTLAATMPPASA
jgi:hypothetical protein